MHPGLLPWGSVNWQYRELAMASTRVKCIDSAQLGRTFLAIVARWALQKGGNMCKFDCSLCFLVRLQGAVLTFYMVVTGQEMVREKKNSSRL